jgi:tRNA (mo5U34)-methyltransferase
VLFLGVLYHLRDPLLALDKLWDVCRPAARLILETQLLDNALLVGDGRFRTLTEIDPDLGEACLMQFYPADSLNGDRSNYWAPNSACARELLRTAGFEVDHEAVSGARGIFHARQMTDPLGMYDRRLEKTTVQQAATPRPDLDVDGARLKPSERLLALGRRALRRSLRGRAIEEHG